MGENKYRRDDCLFEGRVTAENRATLAMHLNTNLINDFFLTTNH